MKFRVLIMTFFLFLVFFGFAFSKTYIILSQQPGAKSSIKEAINDYIGENECEYYYDKEKNECRRCQYGSYNSLKDRCEFVKYELVVQSCVHFHDANNACANRGPYGHLVTILSSQEDNIVDQLAEVADDTWIGLTDEDFEGNFYWVTGEPVLYTNWHSGEPNNKYNAEDWVHISKGWGMTWNDIRDSLACQIEAYLCEYEYDPNFVINLPPICPEGYIYIKEGNKGLCIK